MTRTTRWAASGIAAVALLLAGFWSGKAVPTSAATPREESGVVREVGLGGDEFLIRLTGSHEGKSVGAGSRQRAEQGVHSSR